MGVYLMTGLGKSYSLNEEIVLQYLDIAEIQKNYGNNKSCGIHGVSIFLLKQNHCKSSVKINYRKHTVRLILVWKQLPKTA